MGKGAILFGKASTSPVSASTAEAAAEEYFFNRVFSGNWAPKPPIERWSTGTGTVRGRAPPA